MSSNNVCSFLISWSTVSHLGFWQGLLGFNSSLCFPSKLFSRALGGCHWKSWPSWWGGVPDVEIVSALTRDTGDSGTDASWLASSGWPPVVELMAVSALCPFSSRRSGRGRSSVIPSSNGLWGGVWRIGNGLGLPTDGSWGEGTSNKANVSPIDASGGGEPGGVSAVTGISLSWFNHSTNSATFGEEGSEGIRLLHSPAASSSSEGILLTAYFPILIFKVSLAALLLFLMPFLRWLLGGLCNTCALFASTSCLLWGDLTIRSDNPSNI